MHARLDRGNVQLLTRTGLDWSRRYPRTIVASRSLPVRNLPTQNFAKMSAFVPLKERSSMPNWHTSLSCEYRQKLFVDLPVVVEDRASQFLVSPSKDRPVR